MSIQSNLSLKINHKKYYSLLEEQLKTPYNPMVARSCCRCTHIRRRSEESKATKASLYSFLRNTSTTNIYRSLPLVISSMSLSNVMQSLIVVPSSYTPQLYNITLLIKLSSKTSSITPRKLCVIEVSIRPFGEVVHFFGDAFVDFDDSIDFYLVVIFSP